MTGRKRLTGVLAVAALGVAAAAILSYAGQPRRTGGGTPPYYKRTGFLSSLLMELNTAATGVAAIHVPDGFEVTSAAAPGLVTYPMFLAFDDRGRLFVCESAGRNISDQEMDKLPEMRIRLL